MFQCLFFVLMQTNISNYIICMTVPLTLLRRNSLSYRLFRHDRELFHESVNVASLHLSTDSLSVNCTMAS